MSTEKLTGIDQICLGPFALICSPVTTALSHHQLDCQWCNTAREGFWLGGFVLLLQVLVPSVAVNISINIKLVQLSLSLTSQQAFVPQNLLV